MRRYFILIIGALVVFSLALFTFKQFQIATLGDESTVKLTGSITDQSSIPECGTDEIIMRNPFLQEELASRVACSAPEVNLDTAQVITIPVVMHILHVGEVIGEGTNISTEQAESCIRNLNERFRGDVTAMAEYADWQGNGFDEEELALVIDSKIEFCLASRDPQNLPTNGIIRHDCSDLTYNGESYALDGIASSSTQSGVIDSHIKSIFHWPIEDYFNFYVVSEIGGNNAGNGIQGYSYVGSLGTGSSGYRAGPVCLYNTTGDIGNLKIGRVMNATWAHEVGHAFLLYHTFNNGSCDLETNPCSQGDQVPDTPPTTSNNGCSPNQCPDAIVENYMDYTSESCKTMFTQNQIERMRHELWNDYAYLVSNTTSCQSPNDNDLAITNVTLPQSWCQPTLNFSVSVSNFGGSSVTGASLFVNGEQIVMLPTIAAAESFTVQLTDYEIESGDFEIEILWDNDDYLDNNYYYTFVDPNVGIYTQVLISPDAWSNEIDWEITDELGEIVMSGGDYPVFSQDITFEEVACLPEGCYTFTITDSANDGMCSIDLGNDGICDASYDAFINIISNDNLVFELSELSEVDYGSELIFDFCLVDCDDEICPFDLDGDCVVGVSDVLNLISDMGCLFGDCLEADFNGDGVVANSDLLIILAHVGENCLTGLNSGIDLPTSVKNLLNEEAFEVIDTEVYDLSGRRINRSIEALSAGQYIVVKIGKNGELKSEKIFVTK